MLGRRRSRSAPEAVDITERIRRRALDLKPVGTGVPANSGNRFPPPRPAEADAPGGGSAKLLSFAQTPVYRLYDSAPVERAELHQVLAVLSDRLEAQGPLGDSRRDLEGRIGALIDEVLVDLNLRLNSREQVDLVDLLVGELIGLGPLEGLLADETVSEIMVNGPDAIFVERRGRVQATDVAFRGAIHLMSVVERIAERAGRRNHELQPVMDIRIDDDVWANIVVPPLAVDGPTMTIRKVAREAISLDRMVRQGNLSADMATVLKVAVRCRLNVVISGASGSGKTTLLGALSESIAPDERIVTVEDTGELRLRHTHVVSLETRPLNRIGRGKVTQRQLLRNALRMRPDRVVVDELRGSEAIDLVPAMSSGHDGVLTTLHAGRPREALGRLEILVPAASADVSARSYRAQVAQAVDLIVHVERMDDGQRRVTRVTEVVGLEDDTIVTQDLIAFAYTGTDDLGRVQGAFKATGLKPRFMDRVGLYGLEDTLRHALASRRES